MLDFILYLFVVFFIFNKLFSILGKEDDDSIDRGKKYGEFFSKVFHGTKEKFAEPSARKMKKVVVDSLSVSESDLCEGSRTVLNEVRKRDRGFALDSFMDRATKAFAMCYALPTSNNEEALAMLVTERMLKEMQEFEGAYSLIKRDVLKIRDKKVLQISKEEGKFVIEMEIISDQKYFGKDSKGNVVLGNENKSERVTNICKLVNSPNDKNEDDFKIWKIDSVD